MSSNLKPYTITFGEGSRIVASETVKCSNWVDAYEEAGKLLAQKQAENSRLELWSVEVPGKV